MALPSTPLPYRYENIFLVTYAQLEYYITTSKNPYTFTTIYKVISKLSNMLTT